MHNDCDTVARSIVYDGIVCYVLGVKFLASFPRCDTVQYEVHVGDPCSCCYLRVLFFPTQIFKSLGIIFTTMAWTIFHPDYCSVQLLVVLGYRGIVICAGRSIVGSLHCDSSLGCVVGMV